MTINFNSSSYSGSKGNSAKALGKVPQAKPSPLLPNIQPRKRTESSGDELVQQALTLTEPVEKIDSEALNYRASLVDYICSPEAVTQKSIKTGGLIGAVLGVLGAGGALAFMASREHTNLDAMKIAGSALAGVLGGGALGVLTGWMIGHDKAENQQWLNKNIFQMMDLTDATASMGEGNKALKNETGDSFTQRLGRRENRQREEMMVAAMM